ncbi:class I SAM-dependent methyltransferase [Sungkyunkwania multivorans]|uniref:Class I SAM-dependent methyltransferase n=1 Tax=Sungkyunkwania multivorans TaxID=1173618 RepID=A0ABW3CWP2_9FLAO
MFEFHGDKARYFNYQYLTSKEHIIPFVESELAFDKQLNVLEIGCAEAGVLKAFTELGHRCTGIELSESRVQLAKEFFAEELAAKQIKFIIKDIYDIRFPEDLQEKFDLVILKDVIEHIHDQERFIKRLEGFLSPNGKVFFGFPPWQMPFGGHQQLCRSNFLGKLPYFHLLPKILYKGMLKLFGEKEATIAILLEIKETGISLERFERILEKESFAVKKKRLFLTNPIYRYKFGLKTRRQFNLIARLPYLRNFFTSCGYYVVGKK